MASEEDIPAYTSDLIDWLEVNVKSPTFPMTAKGAQTLDQDMVRLGCFQAGARGLVEQLIAWRGATEENHGQAPEKDSEGDGTALRFPHIYDSDGSVVEISSPVRVVDGEPK